MSAGPTGVPAPSVRAIHILYAEDVRELRELTGMILKPQGHTFESCENGQLAWDRVRATPNAFDLIITDHHMPLMNGLEFVLLLRALPFHGKIVVFSSDLQPGTAALYRELNVDRILSKPIVPQVLRQIIAELFPSGAPGA